MGLNISHTSTVKIVALLLKADDRDDMRAAIITAIINPTRPVGRTFNTSLKKKCNIVNNNYVSSHEWKKTEKKMF